MNISSTKTIHVIVAMARHGLIGRAGRLPWNLPEDWRQFLEKTRGGILIHGRRCQEHHGAALPEREVIVLSRDPNYKIAGARVARSLEEALKMAQASAHAGPIWLGGGKAVYEEGVPLADKIYLTEIDAEFAGDTYLSEDIFARAGFTKVLEERLGAPGPVRYGFKVLGRVGK